MQQFLGDPDSGILNIEAHRLALAIIKKILDEYHFRTDTRPWTGNHHPSR